MCGLDIYTYLIRLSNRTRVSIETMLTKPRVMLIGQLKHSKPLGG